MVAFVALVALAGGCGACSRVESERVCAAEFFVLGPGSKPVIVGLPDGGLAMMDGSGTPIGSPLDVPGGVADVVFREDGAALVISGRRRTVDFAIVSLWTEDAHLSPLAEIALPRDVDLVPCLNGGASSGVLRCGRLALVEIRNGVRRVLRLDVHSGAVEEWPGVPRERGERGERGVALASVAPDGAALAIVHETGASATQAGAGARFGLVVIDAAGVTRAAVDAVEPVQPSWILGEKGLLFVRRGGGICRLALDGSEPEWLCEGAFTTGIARPYVTEAADDEGEVTIEKLGFDGFVQVFSVALFAGDGHRVRQLTTGDVDHFAATWSPDRRFLAFRQRRLSARADAEGAAEEKVIILDTADGFRASTLTTRDAAGDSDRIGPCFSESSPAVYFIAGGALYRTGLDS